MDSQANCEYKMFSELCFLMVQLWKKQQIIHKNSGKNLNA